MARRTYDKALELAAGVYPHKDKKSYVFTQTASGRKREKDQNVQTDNGYSHSRIIYL